ncbi:hypothetical protein [Hymenobacter algoricola]|uniref:DUF937 domain-containing protein n=1 Tax=Hymenobacter algoricola TaxID=486267 RepID=A0ABP7NJ73_9BACT
MYQNEFAQEFEQSLGQEQEYGSSQEMYEFDPEYLGELNGETYEMNGESYEMHGELNETQEMELAHELLEVTNEQELNMFLGKLIRGAGRAVSNFAKSSIGRTIGGALKSVGKTVLPLAGKALGSFVGGPIGGMIGGQLGSAASNLFELELEGLSPEDQEFETARAFVRFANSAARRGAAIQRQSPGINPQTAVRTALGQAAKRHAPGLLRTGGRNRDASGRFTSRGGRRPGAPGFGGRRPVPMNPGTGPSFSNFNFGGGSSGAAGGSNGYDAGNQGYDPGSDASDDGQGYAGNGNGNGAGATRGTWQRQGRTLIVQL